MGLEDFDMAGRFRDVITVVARQTVEQVRPRITYGTVQSIDRTAKKCYVTFPGEATTVPLSMNSLQPASVGQVVRVEGDIGDRYVGDVIGPSGAAQINAGVIGGTTVTASTKVISGGASSTAAEPVVALGTSAGVYMTERDGATRGWSLYGQTNRWNVFSSNVNRKVFAINDSGQAWFSRLGHFLSAGDMPTMNNHALIVANNASSGGAAWNQSTMNLRNADALGEVSISFWCSGTGTAPILRHYGPQGEQLDAVNNSNGAYVPLRASAFTVVSSQRFKQNVRGLDIATQGPRAAGGKVPANPRWTDGPKTLRAKRWRKPATVLTSGHEHVCGQDCDRSPENPCPIGFEDHRDQVGFVAEELAQVFPDAVKFDTDSATPLAIDLSALVALLWESVNELVSRVEALEARPGPRV